MTDQTALVERVLELSLAMEHAVLMEDWQGAARLCNERAPLVMSLRAEQTPRSLEHIGRIRAITSRISKTAETAMTELTEEFRETRSRVDAAQRYLQGSRF